MKRKPAGALNKKISWKWRLIAIALLPLAHLVHLGAARAPEWVENAYSRAVYPVIATPLVAVTNLVPFSVGELLYVVFALVVLGAMVVALVRLFRRQRTVWNVLLRGLLNVLTAAGLLYALVTVVWMLNYHRDDVARLAGLDVSPPSPEELRTLCEDLVAEVNELRGQIPEDENGVMALPTGKRNALIRAEIGYRYAKLAYPWLPDGPMGRPKGLLFSRVTAATGVSGYYSPLTGEANVITNGPDCTLPHTAAHEIAHQLGFAHEGEANFLGYVACRAHPDVDFRYSGAFAALVRSLFALQRHDREAFEEIRDKLNDGVRRDWNALTVFWRKHIVRAAERANDAVIDANLKLHSDPTGIASYGKVVDLLIAERRLRGGDDAETPPDPSP